MLRSWLLCGLMLALAPAAPAVDDAGAEGALVLRDTAVYAAPDRNSDELGQLRRGDKVGVLGRQGLWILLAAENGRGEGWTRLTSLRLTGSSRSTTTAPKQSLGGFARLSRSVGGLLGGLRPRNSEPRSYATLGARGLTAAELEVAEFNAAAWSAVTAAAASAQDAETFARAGGLTARQVPDLPPAGGSQP